jgi:hypothetical protein
MLALYLGLLDVDFHQYGGRRPVGDGLGMEGSRQ